MAKKSSQKPAAKAPAFSPQNNAGDLPPSTGLTRTYPVWQPWNSRFVEQMVKSRDRVQISRFLQEKIPQLEYACQSLPREAVGKGINLKSISKDPAFRKAATDYFRTWADSTAVDLRKESTFYQLQARWLSAMFGDGECFQQMVIAGDKAQEWSLHDRSKRAIQIQTFLRDQLTSSTLPQSQITEGRWIDGLQFNDLDQLTNIRVNLSTGLYSTVLKYKDVPVFNGLGGKMVFHLKNCRRFNQYHGDPACFQSNEDLLDILDLKALRKHSAKVRASLLGATTTRDGQVPNAMQQVMAGEQSGNPKVDTGRRFMQIGEGAVFIPMSDAETMTFFNSQNEAIPFTQIISDLLYPFLFTFGYPPEWIFMRGKCGGTEYRGLVQQVARAHQKMRGLLEPLLQWIWEKVIGNARMPGGALYPFAQVEDWSSIDFIADPDPSVDLGRDDKADQTRIDANQLTAADYIEKNSGNDPEHVQQASVSEKLNLVAYAIAEGKKLGIPASIATILAIPSPKLQAAAGLIAALSPDSIAADLSGLDTPPPPADPVPN
jgi:hypothetical protein